MNPESMKAILSVISLFLYLPKYSLGSGWGFEEVLQFCNANGFKFVTFADIDKNSGSQNYGRLIKRGSLLGIRVRFLELVDDSEDIQDMDMLVRYRVDGQFCWVFFGAKCHGIMYRPNSAKYLYMIDLYSVSQVISCLNLYATLLLCFLAI